MTPTTEVSNTWGDGTLVQVETETFRINIPNNWNPVNPGDIPTPRQWELAFASTSVNERNGYFNNIVVIQDINRLNENSLALMNNTLNTIKNTMLQFQLIMDKEIIFTDKTEGKVIVFQWKYSAQTPILNYIQTSKNCWDISYFLTISTAWEIEGYERYFPILESFTCK